MFEMKQNLRAEKVDFWNKLMPDLKDQEESEHGGKKGLVE
jgi:hypothetical protein